MPQSRASQPRRLNLFDRFDIAYAKKDALWALQAWLVLELGSIPFSLNFALLPAENKILNWLAISIPVGLFGCLLVGMSSEYIRICQDHYRQSANKRSLIWLGLMGSWFGLAGVGFPLSIVAVELWLNFSALANK
jgi:hypothetical protein